MITDVTYLPPIVTGEIVRPRPGQTAESRRDLAPAESATDANVPADGRGRPPVVLDLTASNRHVDNRHRPIDEAVYREADQTAPDESPPQVTYSRDARLETIGATPRGLLIDILA